MIGFGELIAQLLGWLGEFIAWLITFIPRYQIVRCNQLGVKYVGGNPATELKPGYHWYWPVTTEINLHHVNLQTLTINSVSLETKNGIKAQFGMVVSYRIVDALQFEVENYDADTSLEDVAKAGLRNIVVEHDWEDLTAKATEGSRFETKLSARMQASLKRVGVEVESARPDDQIRLDWAGRAFGIAQEIQVGSDE